MREVIFTAPQLPSRLVLASEPRIVIPTIEPIKPPEMEVPLSMRVEDAIGYFGCPYRGLIDSAEQVWVADAGRSVRSWDKLSRDVVADDPSTKGLTREMADKLFDAATVCQNPLTQYHSFWQITKAWTLRFPHLQKRLTDWRYEQESKLDIHESKEGYLMTFAGDENQPDMSRLASVIGHKDWYTVGKEIAPQLRPAHAALQAHAHLDVLYNIFDKYYQAKSQGDLKGILDGSHLTKAQQKRLDTLRSEELKMASDGKHNVSLGVEFQATEPANISHTLLGDRYLATSLSKDDFIRISKQIGMDATRDDAEDDYYEFSTPPCYSPDLLMGLLKGLQSLRLIEDVRGLAIDINVSDLHAHINGAFNPAMTSNRLAYILASTGACTDPNDFKYPNNSYWMHEIGADVGAVPPFGAVDRKSVFHTNEKEGLMMRKIVPVSENVHSPKTVAEYRTFTASNMTSLRALLHNFSLFGAAAKATQKDIRYRDITDRHLAAIWNKAWTSVSDASRQCGFAVQRGIWTEKEFNAFGRLLQQKGYCRTNRAAIKTFANQIKDVLRRSNPHQKESLLI